MKSTSTTAWFICSMLFITSPTYSIANELNNIIPEKKIIVVVPSYNNPIEFTRDCLQSILMQKYSNFEILFCDDCSPQPNIEYIHRTLIAELDMHNKITYVRNHQRYGPIGNQWHAFHSINPDNIEDNREIIVITVDGDDVLLHPNILTKVNEMHQHSWLTYGQYIFYPPSQITDFQAGKVSDTVIAANAWRQVWGFPTGHLRTYRLSLLKDLPLDTFLYKGIFYPAAGDAPLMYSLCEKASFHTCFNPEPLYGYRITDQNELRSGMAQQAIECYQNARNQTPFPPLQELPNQLPLNHYQTDLIIFSYKRPMQLYALLESVEKYITGLQRIVVLYRADDENYEQAYYEVKTHFQNVVFVRQSVTHPHLDFKPLLLQILYTSASEYLIFATDDDIVKDYIEINDCVRALQKTHAYGFYLRLGKNLTHSYIANCIQSIPNLVDVDKNIYALQIDPKAYDVFYDWAYPNTVDMTLYPKETITHALHWLNYNSPTSLEASWAKLSLEESTKIGLCFEQSKMVNIPLNRVQTINSSNFPLISIHRFMEDNTEKLCELFKAGFKIDLQPLHQWNNKSSHAEWEFKFIPRSDN